MERGKPEIFHCIWCKQKVTGKLILVVIDYLKNETTKEMSCPNCTHRITRKTIEGCE